MKSFKQHLAEKAIGQCFPWAYRQAVDHEIPLYHAKVHDPFTGKEYDHAWIEDGNTVKDWQTMELKASKYAGRGWPKKDFYAAYNPKRIKVYKTKMDIVLKAAKTKHYGPW